MFEKAAYKTVEDKNNESRRFFRQIGALVFIANFLFFAIAIRLGATMPLYSMNSELLMYSFMLCAFCSIVACLRSAGAENRAICSVVAIAMLAIQLAAFAICLPRYSVQSAREIIAGSQDMSSVSFEAFEDDGYLFTGKNGSGDASVLFNPITGEYAFIDYEEPGYPKTSQEFRPITYLDMLGAAF